MKLYITSGNKRLAMKENALYFKKHCSSLFEVDSYKCSDFMKKCSCAAEKKVPIEVQEFLLDQRTSRQMLISSISVNEQRDTSVSIDKNQSPVNCKQMKRKNDLKETSEYSVQAQNDHNDAYKENKKIDNLADPDNAALHKYSQNRMKLNNTALTSIRYGVSNRATAAIATSVLIDYNIIKDNDMSTIIDKSKVHREKKSFFSNT
ncbi:hypothetical protein TSAR_013171 [Trichomalopsis sarcophagae]|uniref:Uncharacterized protein n=1 Tax=Trichomalopsis sarcophagae TaxID=543379 RepID=A0A232EDG2_9HYME|nr:hypothetical protein TSAR_013171 [Trichomalopsis sarcophagae]